MHVSEIKIAEGQKESGTVTGRSTHELHSSIQTIERSNDKQLLEALWRSPNHYYQLGELDAKNNNFKNLQVKDAADAIEQAFALSRAGKNTYFACAEYLTPDSRTAANVACSYAFWADIDCGDTKAADGKGYATEADALEALKIFCQKAALPLPTHVVSSGCGLHVYWALDHAVDRGTWQVYARRFKALTRALAFLADDSRTADIASVLRLPGTLNYKYQPPRPVTLLHASGDRVIKAAMLDAIDAAHERLCVVSPKPKPKPTRTPSRRAPIVRSDDGFRRLQMLLRHFDPDMSYDDWVRVGMGVCNETGKSEDGFALFDDWSRTGLKYGGVSKTRATWRSFRTDLENPITIGTLYWMAMKSGVSKKTIFAIARPFEKIGGEDAVA